MAAATDYLENKILDHILGTASYTMPTQVYLGLFTSDPGEDSGGTEVSGHGYARQPIDFDAASGGDAVNSDDVLFEADNTGGFGEITHWVLFDADTSGNRLVHAAWTTPRTIEAEGIFVVEAGSLSVSQD